MPGCLDRLTLAGTAESDLNLEMRERLFAAESEDAPLSKAMTGKQGRMLRT
jgi:NAD(P)H-dependent flavin oxidoreductase YrpB (nitropropane dioxygenase family)